MNKSYIFIGISFVLLAIVQFLVVPFIQIYSVYPKIILLPVVYFSLSQGQFRGTIAGFIFGLIYDLLSGDIWGINAVSLTVAGFFAGYFFDESVTDPFYYFRKFLIILFFTTLIETLINSLSSFEGLDLSFIAFLLIQSILPALYTSFIAVPLAFFRKEMKIS
ncbi:MAG: rod shape-determining protein MreD [Ignavibacteriales bacterium]|nr:rod shape-determining protein MreD [Ignavibacteriales bacterium]MCF8305172.1 rod shape-determining protein MreD [Ignavibacteriales bacterium]MCF8314915.1 rod shape-determining protein MreD [Ignavibacteriales bacterium]MCF8436136.1 rod shape-determining protein MreD [Ignavibacteriales bacterium]